MTTQIEIKSGTYKIRGKDVELAGMVFPMVEEFKVGSQGGYVTVDGSAMAGFPDRNIKIKLTAPMTMLLPKRKQLYVKKQMKRPLSVYVNVSRSQKT